MRQDDGPLVLARRAGTYREARPARALADHVRCGWTHAVAPDHAGPVVVVPDGCVDLLWIDGRLMVAGPDLVAAMPVLAPGTTVVGLRFRPGAAVRWLGAPMSEIVGCQVDLGSFWGARARDLAERIGEAETSRERLARLEAGLGRLAPAIDPPARDMALVFRLLGRHAEESGRGMATLLDRLDISERTLRRRCRDTFGYGPKTLDRILRFQRFLGLAGGAGEARLRALAYEAGYADQAHLTREVRRLSGLTPAAILRQISPPDWPFRSRRRGPPVPASPDRTAGATLVEGSADGHSRE